MKQKSSPKTLKNLIREAKSIEEKDKIIEISEYRYYIEKLSNVTVDPVERGLMSGASIGYHTKDLLDAADVTINRGLDLIISLSTGIQHLERLKRELKELKNVERECSEGTMGNGS